MKKAALFTTLGTVIVIGMGMSIGLSSLGCQAAQRAAREDPMKCERDPKCDKKRGRMQDCSMQCSDDPACVERCEQVQAPQKLGH